MKLKLSIIMSGIHKVIRHLLKRRDLGGKAVDNFSDGIPEDRPFPHPQAVSLVKSRKKKREKPEA